MLPSPTVTSTPLGISMGCFPIRLILVASFVCRVSCMPCVLSSVCRSFAGYQT
jgi:hypothetical protein